MRTRDLQMLDQQMTDHRLGSGQGINATTVPIGRQSLALRIVGEACHNRDRGGTSSHETLSGPQECIRAVKGAPAGSALTQFKVHTQWLISGDHRSDRQAEACATTIGHLKVALTQVGLDPCIQQQTDALLAHGPEHPVASSKTVEAIALHVMNARVTPIERCPVHHIGMGDQATTGCGKQASTGKCIASESPDLAADPRRHHQQGGKNGRHHWVGAALTSTASTCTNRPPPEGACLRPVIAQRSGSPSALSCFSNQGRKDATGRPSGQCQRNRCDASFTSGIDQTALRTKHLPGRQSP